MLVPGSRCKKLPPDIETKAAFCNDQIDLSEVGTQKQGLKGDFFSFETFVLFLKSIKEIFTYRRYQD